MLLYQVGEIVLLEWQGWLKAFRVVEVYELDDTVEYKLELVEADNPGWVRPGS